MSSWSILSKIARHSITFPNNGIIPLYKVPGITSANLLNALKNISKNPIKVGHGGTLDKDARGLLIIGLGESCKDLTHFLHADKSYKATCLFGRETDTLDSSGELQSEFKPFDHLTHDLLERQVQEMFVGDIVQTPPVYSAIRAGGKRLSDWAFKGASVVPMARKLKVYSAKCTLFKSPIAEFEMRVCSGFYVRSYLTDIARSLNTYCYSIDIERQSVGPLSLKHCLRIQDINEDSLFEATLKTRKLLMDYVNQNKEQVQEIQKRQREKVQRQREGLSSHTLKALVLESDTPCPDARPKRDGSIIKPRFREDVNYMSKRSNSRNPEVIIAE